MLERPVSQVFRGLTLGGNTVVVDADVHVTDVPDGLSSCLQTGAKSAIAAWRLRHSEYLFKQAGGLKSALTAAPPKHHFNSAALTSHSRQAPRVYQALKGQALLISRHCVHACSCKPFALTSNPAHLVCILQPCLLSRLRQQHVLWVSIKHHPQLWAIFLSAESQSVRICAVMSASEAYPAAVESHLGPPAVAVSAVCHINVCSTSPEVGHLAFLPVQWVQWNMRTM